MDTYIPMARGFVYLAVMLDWFSRRVQSSIRVQAVFCLETLEDALVRNGKPDIFNTNHCSSSRARPSPVRWPTTTLLSAWTE